MNVNNTIAAISTPLGTGGIGVIRISGPEAFEVAAQVFRAKNGVDITKMRGYTSTLGRVYDGGGELDDAIAQVFRAPKSYTGEHIVELSCHGGIWILQRVLRLCFEKGASPAEPGEFTKRAFLNGKLNLTQAEAVMDIISAQGQSAVKAAISARDGAITNKVNAITNQLVFQSAQLAAWADFPDEDLENLDVELLSRVLKECVVDIDALLKTYDSGKIMREGVTTAIIGRPNVGKSTLMNLLAGECRSIVTDIPGTTRDVVEDSIRLGDFTLRLADTAGIRRTDDPVELAGVARSKNMMDKAELIFAVFDSAVDLNADDYALLDAISTKPCIAIINKIDLPQKSDISRIRDKIQNVVTISAKSGEGRRELEETVKQVIGFINFDPSAGIIANERQRLCLANARNAIIEANAALDSGNMLDAVNVCVDFALDELLSLTGEKVTDRVVDEVFARFCVGK